MKTALGGVVLVIVWVLLRRFAHPDGLWSPAIAWLRAAAYLVLCVLLAQWTGVLHLLWGLPLLQPAQWANAMSAMATALVTLYLLWGYGKFCRQRTLRFSRKPAFAPSVSFGVLWGVATALAWLALWHVAQMLVPFWPWWAIACLAGAMIVLWQLLWMSFFWDPWILPEYQTAVARRSKLLVVYIPSVVLCLAHFAVFQHYWLIVMWLTLAAVLLSFGIGMPGPSSADVWPLPRHAGTALGLRKAAGFSEGSGPA